MHILDEIKSICLKQYKEWDGGVSKIKFKRDLSVSMLEVSSGSQRGHHTNQLKCLDKAQPHFQSERYTAHKRRGPKNWGDIGGGDRTGLDNNCFFYSEQVMTVSFAYCLGFQSTVICN